MKNILPMKLKSTQIIACQRQKFNMTLTISNILWLLVVDELATSCAASSSVVLRRFWEGDFAMSPRATPIRCAAEILLKQIKCH